MADAVRQQGHLPRTGHYRALVTPLLTAAFLALAPDPLWAVALFAVLPAIVDMGSRFDADDHRNPAGIEHRFVYDLPMYLLVSVHWVNLLLAARLVQLQGLFSLHALVAMWLMAQSSSLTGSVPAHELIHRRHPLLRWMGRLLLSSIYYEHFYTEHLWGHHPRVGTYEDCATARFGESFAAFLVRSIPGQLGSAWAIERRRLNKVSKGKTSKGRAPLGWWHNRVLQGICIEMAMTAAFFFAFGVNGLAIFVFHAVLLHIMAQILNYLDHWGLERTKGQSPLDVTLAWDCDNRSVLFSMLAISRHADHHAHPTRPFHGLAHVPNSPKLPGTFARMTWLLLTRNAEFRRLMTEQLHALGLRPNPSAETES